MPNSRNHRNKSHGHNFNQGRGLESEGTGNNSQTPSHNSLDNPEDTNHQKIAKPIQYEEIEEQEFEETQQFNTKDSNTIVASKYLLRAQDGIKSAPNQKNIFSHDTPTKSAVPVSERRFKAQRSSQKKQQINKYSNTRNMTFVEYRE